MGIVLHPAGAVGVRPGGAIREAHRQAQAGRVMATDVPIPTARRSLATSAGTRVGPPPSCRSTRPGWRPARVVAEHRGAYRRDPDGERTAALLGPVPPRGLRSPVRPAGRRRLGRAFAASAATSPPSSRPCCRAGPRSCAAPRASPAGTSPTSRSSRRTSTWRSSSPASTATSTCAASSATSRWRGRAARRPSSSSTRPTSPTTSTGRAVAAEAVAPGVAVHVISALTGDGLEALSGPPGARPHRGRARARRAWASPRSQRARGRGPAAHGRRPRGRLARPPHDHPPRAARLPGGSLLIDTPGIRSLGVAGAADGLDAAFADIADLALDLPVQRLPPRGRARLRDRGAPSPTGRCRRTGSRATASSSARRPTSPARTIPLLQAEERRKWRAIHVAVNQQMHRKYGDDR